MTKYLLGLEKCEKECNILEIILVQGFFPLRIKITQFPSGFRLKLINKDERGGKCQKIFWSQEPKQRAMHNHDNPVSGNHLGTVTVLTSGT